MANIKAAQTGNWSATSTWTGGVVPGAGDNVSSNNFVVTVDVNATVANVTNGTAYAATAGGSFALNNGITLTSNVVAAWAPSLNCVSTSGSASGAIIGNITAGTGFANAHGVVHSSSGTLTISGNIAGGSGGFADGVRNTSSGTIVITTAGGITGGGGTGGYGVHNLSNGIVTISGNVTGGSASTLTYGVNNASIGTVTIIGNVTASSVIAGANNASTGTFTIIGNITASSGANGFTAAGGTNKLSVNAINALNGTAAIYAASYLVSPVPYNGYIRYANDGTNYLNQFTTDSLSAFSMPPISAVRSGVQFANNTLTGTCQIPAAASVSFGVPVDNIVGTAALNPVDFMNVSIASLTATDSLGARLKNSATVESVGRIIASFSN